MRIAKLVGVASAILVAGLLAVACAPQEPETSAPAPSAAPADDGWTLGDPATAGFDAAALATLAADVEAGEFPNTHALLVEHDGALVYERYFNGTDERWGESLGEITFGPDDLHDLRSISKSVTAALLGIALADNFEAALRRPVADFFPALDVADDKRAITLHHVLTMTAGLQWNEMTVPYTDPANDEIALYSAAEPARHVLGRPLEHPPGEVWYYSGGLSQMLASMIYGLTGQHLDDYAETQLFGPLGITDFEWLGPGNWTPDEPAAMSGLRLRARDLAKIGSVFLHGGRWNGRQVVPQEWIARSVTRHVQEIGDWSDDGKWGYGYQWWVGALPTGEEFAAGVGNGNQRLFVLPDSDLVVTVLAGEYNRFTDSSDRLLERVLSARSVTQ